MTWFVRVAAALIGTAALLYPAVADRWSHLQWNAGNIAQTDAAFAAEADDLSALIETLRGLPPGRVYAGQGGGWGKDYRVGSAPMYAVLNTAGFDMLGFLYHALSLNADVQVLFDESRPEHYNLFDVRYVVAPAERSFPPFVRPVGTFGRHHLYSVETSGYFDWTSARPAFAGERDEWYPAASAWLRSEWPRLAQQPAVYLGTTPQARPGSLALAEAAQTFASLPEAEVVIHGRVLSETVAGPLYAAEVATGITDTLVLKATYHPHLRATIDGAPVEAFMVLPAFAAIEVPPGIHDVRFEYAAGSLRGVLLAGGALLLAAVGLFEWRRGRRKPVRRAEPVRRAAGPPGLPHDDGGRPRAGFRLKLGIYLCFLGVYLLTAAGHFLSTDEIAVYLATEGLVERGSIAIRPLNDSVQASDGRYYNAFGIGQSIASIPLYALGRAVDAVAPPAVRDYFAGKARGNWGGTVPVFFVSTFNQIITPLACVLVFLFGVELGFSLGVSLALAAAFGLGTSSWVYARAYFQHPLETLCLLAAVYVLFRARAALRAWDVLLAGALLGAAVLTRGSVVLIVPLVALYVSYLTVRSSGPAGGGNGAEGGLWRRGVAAVQALWVSGAGWRGVRSVLLLAVPVVPAVVLTLYLNHLRFGSSLMLHPPAARLGLAKPLWEGLYGNLFSVGRGIFLYSPPILLGAFAFPRFYRRWRAEALLFAAIVAVYYVFYSLYRSWEGGWCFGPRFLLATVPFVLLPAGLLLDGRGNRVLAVLLVAFGAGVQLLGVIVSYTAVYWEWAAMHLNPERAYVFDPGISPLAMHLRALLEGRNIDLWLGWIMRRFGPEVGWLTALALLAVLAAGLVLIGGTSPAVRRSAAAVRARLAPHAWYLLALGGVWVLAGSPLLRMRIMSGHDALEYLPRAVEFYAGLQGGQWFPRWAADLSGGYGQPFFSFNPPLFYYVSAFFHAMGFSFVAAQDWSCLALLGLGALGMYALAGEVTGRRGGFVAGTAYLLAPYLLAVLFVRHALADFTGFAFVPWALWGVARAAAGGRRWTVPVGAAGVAAVLLSSNPVALMTVPALVAFAAWLGATRRSWRALLRGWGSIVLGLGLSAFFWLPALAERGFVHLDRLKQGYLAYANHFVYWTQYVASPWGFGLSLPGPADGMSFALGPVHLALSVVAAGTLLYVYIIRRGASLRDGGTSAAGARWASGTAFFLLLLGAALYLGSTSSAWLWDRLPLLQYLEFPWRLLTLAAVGAAYLCAAPFAWLDGRWERWARVWLVLVTAGLLVTGLRYAGPESFLDVADADFAPEAIAQRNLSVTTAREYEPVWVVEAPVLPPAAPLIFVSGWGSIAPHELRPELRTFHVSVGEEAWLQTNTFYFPGWTLYVDGSERPVNWNPVQGTMVFPLEAGEHDVRLVFEDTPVRRWASWISLWSLAAVVVVGIMRRGARARR